MQLGRYGRNLGWIVTAVLAVIYGMVVAFGPDGSFQDAWIRIGAIVVGVAFVACMVIPLVIWLIRRRSTPTAP